MKKNIHILLLCAIIMLFVISCQIFSTQVDENAVATAAAQTMQAKQPTDASAGPPTVTPMPTYTVAVAPTATPKPCNKAKFISETVPDGSEFSPNEGFTKSWRLKNIGTCTWNTGYCIELQSGKPMGAGNTRYFTQIIKPGEFMDVVLELEAPSSDGEYTSWWQLKDDSGKKFAQLYVQIEVK